MKTLTATSAAAPSTTFTEKKHYEQDLLSLLGVFHDPEADFWLWNTVMSLGSPFDTKTLHP